jgi:glycosyltransferase involved in cell wall biosynthesis
LESKKLNDKKDFLISVVIPFHDRTNILQLIFEKLQDQTVLPKEIIIVDSSTSDSAERLISNYSTNQKVIYKRVKKSYPGKARNIGVELASGVWIAFLDSKTLPERNWLERFSGLLLMVRSGTTVCPVL